MRPNDGIDERGQLASPASSPIRPARNRIRELDKIRSSGGAARAVGRRVLAAIPVLIGVTLLTFFVVNVLPGNMAQQLLGPRATLEQVATLEARLGLNRPVAERYWEWLTNVLSGDLGNSLASGQPVAGLLKKRLPVTLLLAAYAFALSLAAAVAMALVAARKPNGIADRLGLMLSTVSLSVAGYVLALVLVLVFAVHWRWFPSIGFTPLHENVTQHLRSLTLPVLAIAFPLFGFYARFLRGDLVEQIHTQDYIVVATAKGIGPWRVLVRHAFVNSLFGLLTLVGLNFGTVLSGTVIIEQIFALPGIGQLLVQAINYRDVIVIQAIVLLCAVASILANLAVDILYTLLDPRIRYGRP